MGSNPILRGLTQAWIRLLGAAAMGTPKTCCHGGGPSLAMAWLGRSVVAVRRIRPIAAQKTLAIRLRTMLVSGEIPIPVSNLRDAVHVGIER
ncbi:hypothetical protein C7S18_10520 [Ahniella affigens]|uniref:Uncharacterized protein n=1 Tax=Ahniella affigens TaxID=2021234 RepID=A0A2P1PRZ1_9GAMM|nr:hypothetical protein C7S18_10520 [Ahniella affigens]